MVTKKQFQTLTHLFDYYNVKLFEGTLPDTMINMSRKKNSLGFFAPQRWVATREGIKPDLENPVNEISLNPDWLLGDPIEWHSTLVHEMCHLWQYAYGKYSGAYHNAQWAAKMTEIGLIPSHTGYPGGKQTGQKMNHYIDESGVFVKVYNEIKDADYSAITLPYMTNQFTEVKKKDGGKSKSGVKVKYSCSCGNNVWGKADLKLTCDECKEAFEPEN
jgi:predicted SprT family Zn-dependent metalloprotease